MKTLIALVLVLTAISLSASEIEQTNTNFSTVNIILGSIKDKLPAGCRIEREEPVIVSRSPILVNYKFKLIKERKSTAITFEQSQSDFIISSDNQSFEEVRSSDNKLIVRLNAQEEVTFLKVNNLECSL